MVGHFYIILEIYQIVKYLSKISIYKFSSYTAIVLYCIQQASFV